MSKIIKLLALILSAQVFAQTPELSTEMASPRRTEDKPAIQFSAYLGSGTMSFDGIHSYDQATELPAATYGIAALKEFGGERWSVVTGIRYLRQSAKFQRAWTSSSYSRSQIENYGLDTAGIPLIGKYRFAPTGNGSHFYAGLGAEPIHEFGLEDETTTTFSIDGKNTERTTKDWTKDGLRPLNVLVLAIVGAEIPTASSKKILLEGGYNRTLLPINQDNGYGFKAYTESFLFSVGLAL